MRKRIDERTPRDLRIKQEMEQRIVAAYTELIREGILMPSARATARRAQLSLRVIFKHFASVSALRLAAITRIEEQSRDVHAEPIRYEEPVEQRIEHFVERQSRMFEMVAPFRRAAMMVESVDPLIAAAMTRVRQAAIDEIERTLGPTLKSLASIHRRMLITSLHVVCSWPSWETLRAHHGLAPVRARRSVTRMALSILRDALR